MKKPTWVHRPLAIAALAVIATTSNFANAAFWGTAVSGRTATSQFGGGDASGQELEGLFSPSSILNFSDSNATLFAESTINMSSGIETNLLKASVDATNRGTAVARGLNLYTYSGAEKMLSLNALLDATIIDDGFVRGEAIVISQQEYDTFFDFAGEELAPNLTGFIFEGIFPLASISLSLSEQSSNDSTSGNDNFLVNDGDAFYIWSLLTVDAFNGSVDATNSFSFAFDDNTGLTSAATAPVPLPSAAWFFLSAMGGLVIARRKKKTS